MHVVHVAAPAAFGGLERVLAGLLPALATRDMRVSLIAVLVPEAPEPAFLQSLREGGVGVNVLRLPSRAYRQERQRILSTLQEQSATVVHTHGYRSDVIVGGAAQRAGYPVATTLHGFTRQGWRGRAYEWVQLRAVRNFDAVIAVSAPLAQELEQRGVPSGRLQVIRNGLSGSPSTLLEKTEARRVLALPASAAVIGWVGRLSEEKDPELAIATLAALPDRSAVLALLGDGPLEAQVGLAAERLGVRDRVLMLGAVPDAGRYFRAFDAVLLSSRTEGTPMAILEAALAEVPVVATRVGGVPDLLGERSALLASHGDSTGLARALTRLISNPVEAQQEGRALLQRVRSGGGKDWVESYAALYRTLAAERDRLEDRSSPK